MSFRVVSRIQRSERGVLAKTVGKLALAFFVCLLLFVAFKLAASTIPESAIRNSLLESSAILDQEGDSRSYFGNDASTRLDNFTTAIMLKICASDHAVGFEAAFGDYHYQASSAPENTQTKSFREQLSGDVLSGDGRWASYARYWNGYTIVVKPLLLFFNLNEIRMLFAMSIAAFE